MNRLILFIITMSVAICSFSQVTIGSGEAPIEGALLQLKEFENTPTTLGAANSTKGLLLPRMELKTMNSLVDLNVDASEHGIHAGLMVYNLSTEKCENIFPGVYTWDGTQWGKIGNIHFKIGNLEDERDNENYPTIHFLVDNPSDPTKPYNAGEWMLENLRADRYTQNTSNKRDLELHDSNTVPVANTPYYSYPGNDASKLSTEGYFYSGEAALNGALVEGIQGTATNTPSREVQGICPDGWRIPTYEDWLALENVMKASNCDFSFPKHNTDKHLGGLINSDGVNANYTSRPSKEGGFSAYTAGSYNENRQHNSIMGAKASFITTYPVPYSTSGSATNNNHPVYGMFSFDESTKGTQFHTLKSEMMPVRCVKTNGVPAINKSIYASKYDSYWP